MSKPNPNLEGLFSAFHRIFSSPGEMFEAVSMPVAGKSGKTVWYIDSTETVDKIILILYISRHPKVAREDETMAFILNHDDFNQWLDEEGYLKYDMGQEDDLEMGYAEFMSEHCDKYHYKEYLVSKKLVPDSYEWNY